MNAEVKILIEGRTNADTVTETEQEETWPTITLVRDGDSIMVVDPGILENQKILVDALKKENLTVEDVNVICITHSHIDHYRNIGMFPSAKILEYYGLWNKVGVESWTENFSPNIRVLHTPGHDYTGISLFVTTGLESKYPGVVAICGDVFWREDYPANPQDDIYASDFEKLKESRKKVLEMADWIVPGHGAIYKNERADSSAKGKDQEIIPKKSKALIYCKNCDRQMKQKDQCECRPYICFRCCECETDCNLCSCSHKNE